MNNSQLRVTLRKYIETKYMYDAETAQLTKNYERTLHKIARHKNHLDICSIAQFFYLSSVLFSCVCSDEGCSIAVETSASF